jgi:hypothetical protein
MRLPFPEHIPMVPVFYFAVTLCAIQQLQGTNSTFSLCAFFYIIVASLAFNIVGGFTRPSGAFIFFNSVLSVILGLCVKAYLNEPADSNLQSPILTISVYLAGMCMMCVAALLSRKISTKRAILGKMLTDAKMQTATVGSMFTGFFLFAAGFFIQGGNGSVLSALAQLNKFLPMALILGVLNTARRSGGTRSINLPVLISASFMFGVGVLNFSKESMFAPFAAWLIAAASQRLSLSRQQIFALCVGIFILFHYLVPYSQYGRTFKEEGGVLNVQTSLNLITHLGYVREQYLETSTDAYEERVVGWFNAPQGLFDRLEMVAMDDALVNHTKQFGTIGFAPVIESFENLVPHFLWPGKPPLLSGNLFAHEVGVLGEEDESTGVSFSSPIVAYHLIGWPGIFFLAPFLWFLLFTVFDSLCGDVRKAPWGLLAMVLFAHAAPEGDINSTIYVIFYGALGIAFAAVMGAYVMPFIGTFIIGPEGVELRRGGSVRSIAGRLLLPPPPKPNQPQTP